jgi:hypothetical protein
MTNATMTTARQKTTNDVQDSTLIEQVKKAQERVAQQLAFKKLLGLRNANGGKLNYQCLG